MGEIRETTLSREELAQIYEQVKVTLFGYSEVFAVRVAFAEDWPSLEMINHGLAIIDAGISLTHRMGLYQLLQRQTPVLTSN